MIPVMRTSNKFNPYELASFGCNRAMTVLTIQCSSEQSKGFYISSVYPFTVDFSLLWPRGLSNLLEDSKVCCKVVNYICQLAK